MVNPQKLQWESEYRPFVIPKAFEYLTMKNGRSMCYVLCTKLTIQILDKYIRKQDCIHLSNIPMVRLSGVMLQKGMVQISIAI